MTRKLNILLLVVPNRPFDSLRSLTTSSDVEGPGNWRRTFCLTILLVLSLLIPSLSWSQSVATSATPASKSPVDTLIPWLFQEGNALRGIPFSEVILAATGKRVLPIDPKNETDQRVIKQISGVLDEVMRRLNAPDSVIQGIPRINEVSSHFEDSMRELLNTTPGLSCDFPRTAEDQLRRSGYPDLRLVDRETKRVFTSIPSSTRSAAATVVSVHSISNQKARPTKCATTPCILSSASSMKSETVTTGASLAGIWSISRIFE
jgi:hypothetical protein